MINSNKIKWFCLFIGVPMIYAMQAEEQNNLVKQQIDKSVGTDAIIYQTQSNSFEKFVRWTNEKQKTAEAILKVVGDTKESLLDIGAGDGVLTKLIEEKFTHITAVELGPHLFELLMQKCGSNKYKLFNSTFETAVLQGKFDIILSSHSFRYFQDPMACLYRIKDLLKDFGIFLLLDVSQESEFWKFYRRYEKDVLGAKSPYSVVIEYDNLLKKVFNIEKICFTTTLTIPSVDDVISIFDFFYDIDFSKIKEESLAKIKDDLQKCYGNGPIKLDFQEMMYVCSIKNGMDVIQK